MLLVGSVSDRRLLRWVGVIAVLGLTTVVTGFDFAAAITAAAAQPDQPPGPVPVVSIDPVADPDAEGPFLAPVDVIVRPGDDRLFVVELTGTVVAVVTSDDEASELDSATILDVSDRTLVQGERGLLGAAFHPSRPFLYIHHSDLDGDSVIAEYRVDPDTGIADADSRRELLTVAQPHPNHNGGEVEFGPDGYLYLGFGDGGSANDPDRTALDLRTPLGKILRIDPRPTDDAPFTIPPDNPFLDVVGADPAIWSLGLRNPWKFSFDPATGGLWIADVGQDQWEEINGVLPSSRRAGRGDSFGWSAYEGPARFNGDQRAEGHIAPFFAYERIDGRCSISGGAVYRGSEIPQLRGYYVFGDFCTGEILAVDTTADYTSPLGPDDQADADALVAEPLVIGRLDGVVSIAADRSGELYAVSVMGTVARLGAESPA